jgi:hypothetical protein
MKKVIIQFAVIVLLFSIAHAEQKTVTVGTSGSPASLDTNFGNIKDNFDELYAHTYQLDGLIADGESDDTAAINTAISEASTGGGVIRFPVGKIIRASGITPASNVTLDLNGSTIKNIDEGESALIEYNSNDELTNFNIINGALDGNGLAQNVINITQPTPSAHDKTWSYSTIFNVSILNSSAIGIYCPIPGRVRLVASRVYNHDIGIAFDREHLDIYNSSIEYNRIGARTTGNHFAWVHAVFAHNGEAGVTTDGAGLGTYDNIAQAVITASTFIDNGEYSIRGPLNTCRISDSRFSNAEKHIDGITGGGTIIGNYFEQSTSWAIDNAGDRANISSNYFTYVAGGIRSSAESLNVTISNNVLRLITNDAIYLMTPKGGVVSGNTVVNAGAGVVVNSESPSGRFAVIDNYLDTIDGIGIEIAGDDSYQVDDIRVDGNTLIKTGLESIKITGSVQTFGSTIIGNKILDANQTEGENVSAIYVQKNFRGGLINGNSVRNSAAGHAYYAISVAGGTGVDSLLSNNVARGMSAANSYLIGASFTVADNIGSIAP